MYIINMFQSKQSKDILRIIVYLSWCQDKTQPVTEETT